MVDPLVIEHVPDSQDDAIGRLFLLLARETLSSVQVAQAKVLATQITDWHAFASMAHANHSLPFLYHHIRHLSPFGPGPDFEAALRRAATLSTMRTLRISAALSRFHDGCVAPLNADHVYFKGPALSIIYYRQPNLRIARDIDVLIGPRHFRAVVNRALAQGGRILLDEHEGTFAQDPQDISFMVRHNDVISLIDRDNVHFEIHRKIEKQTTLFDQDAILRTAATFMIGKTPARTMRIDWLFCYLTYHHSRHFWSRLHWVADLHALMAHPNFNKDEVLALGTRLGLSTTVEAAMALAHLTDKPEQWASHLGKTHAGSFLEACLRGVPGDSAFEIANLKHLFLFDFANPWQVEAARKNRFWARSAWHRLAPNFTQYMQRRLPRVFEFLYVIENAGILFQNATRHIRRP